VPPHSRVRVRTRHRVPVAAALASNCVSEGFQTEKLLSVPHHGCVVRASPPSRGCAHPKLRAWRHCPELTFTRTHALAGAYLSQPVTEKLQASGEDERLSFGVAAMQGWRTSMEDAHAVRTPCAQSAREGPENCAAQP
jgi:hypothetical protein